MGDDAHSYMRNALSNSMQTTSVVSQNSIITSTPYKDPRSFSNLYHVNVQDTSFEQVYESLQKDIEIVEQQSDDTFTVPSRHGSSNIPSLSQKLAPLASKYQNDAISNRVLEHQHLESLESLVGSTGAGAEAIQYLSTPDGSLIPIDDTPVQYIESNGQYYQVITGEPSISEHESTVAPLGNEIPQAQQTEPSVDSIPKPDSQPIQLSIPLESLQALVGQEISVVLPEQYAKGFVDSQPAEDTLIAVGHASSTFEANAVETSRGKASPSYSVSNNKSNSSVAANLSALINKAASRVSARKSLLARQKLPGDSSLFDFPDADEPSSVKLKEEQAEVNKVTDLKQGKPYIEQSKDNCPLTCFLETGLNQFVSPLGLLLLDEESPSPISSTSNSIIDVPEVPRAPPQSHVILNERPESSNEVSSSTSVSHEKVPDSSFINLATPFSLSAEAEDDKIDSETDCGSSDSEDNEDSLLPGTSQDVSSSKPKFDVYKHIKDDSDALEQQSKVYHCGICGNFAALTKETLEKHWKSHYQEKPFKCPHCDKSFKFQSLLNTHMNAHIGVKPHACPDCHQSFVTKGELTRHIRYRHTSFKPHQCPECDYASVEISKLKRHMRSHTGEKPFQCHLCPYSCADNFKLKRHLKTHTGEKPYECPICKARFTQSGSMKQHLLGHTGDKPRYQCEFCDTTCGRKSDLKQHMLKLHTSQLPQKCRYCNASFPDRFNLKEHVRTHRGEKNHKCDVCDYRCSSQKQLIYHTLIHTGERPHVCSQCGMNFRVKQQLKEHVAKLHPNGQGSGSASGSGLLVSSTAAPPPPPLTRFCPKCSRALSSKGVLRQHLRQVHKCDQDEIDRLTNETGDGSGSSNEISSSDVSSCFPDVLTMSDTRQPTILLAFNSNHVTASLWQPDVEEIGASNVSNCAVQTEFQLSTGHRVSVIVAEAILQNPTLVQSLVNALEQNVATENVPSSAIKYFPEEIGTEGHSVMEQPPSISGDAEISSQLMSANLPFETPSSATASSAIDDSLPSAGTGRLYSFSTIDTSALATSSSSSQLLAPESEQMILSGSLPPPGSSSKRKDFTSSSQTLGSGFTVKKAKTLSIN